MKLRVLGLAIALVAMAVLVNVLALQAATVNSTMTVNVVNTATALLALSAPGTPDSDVVVSTASGVLTVTFADGMQPNSDYTFAPIFRITNNSADALEVTVTTSGEPAGLTVTLTDTSDNPLTSYALAAAASVEVKLVVSISGAVAIANHPVTVTVAAVKP